MVRKEEKVVREKMSLISKIKRIKNEHKFLYSLIFVFIIFLFIFFGARIYLLFNFLIGNDTIVQLTSSTQEFSLANSEKAIINFDSYVSTNFFCIAHCTYELKDLSSGELIDKNGFNTKISNPRKISYELEAPSYGKGQKLFHFEINCQSKKSTLCRTSEKKAKKSSLIVMDYFEGTLQEILKKEATKRMEESLKNYNNLSLIQKENQALYETLNKTIFIEKIKEEKNYSSFENNLNDLFDLWENYNYREILDSKIFEEISKTKQNLSLTNSNLSLILQDYNLFVSNLEKIYEELISLSNEENISLENYNEIEKTINEYNSLDENSTKIFELNSSLNYSKEILSRIEIILGSLNKTFTQTYVYSNFSSPKISKIIKPVIQVNEFILEFPKQEEICCYSGVCEVCCDDSCKNNESLYPIILVHGHSFNEKISADARLSDFDEIKDRLFEEGIIDGGYLFVDYLENPEVFSKVRKRMVFSISYYFDIYKNEEGIFHFQSKAESLDTYAIRLNDIIKNIQLMTNREKVNIVSHSMGGLVSRNYLQTFGEGDTNKLIMIGTPNNGIGGYIKQACPIFGADIHCEMMDEESSFIKKLNGGEIPKINVSVISGIGCNTDGEDGDGIVTNRSVFLPWAKMYYVPGNCSGVRFFHIEMREVSKYPEIYEIIKSELNLNEEKI